MSARIVKDNTLPSHWKRIVTKDHRYIVTQGSNTRSIESEVFHSDDCTLNNRVSLFTVKGSIKKTLFAIGNYEVEQAQLKIDFQKIDKFLGLEVGK